jgi:hypothetical protein
MHALSLMRLAAEPDDDPSNKPVSETNKEPEPRSDVKTVEFDTAGDM